MNYHRDRDYLKSESLFRNIFRKRFELICPFIKKRGRVLDIGCSNGIFLDLFKEDGWKTWGVEPSGIARIATPKGHKIIRAVFEEADLPKGYFDLVVLNHTLEHLNRPLAVLKKAYLLLKDGGWVYIDVPNAGGLSARLLGKKWPLLLPKEHKHQFTKASLTKLLKQAGFEIVYSQSRSGLFEFSNPWQELWQSLIAGKKRFFEDLFGFPGALIATLINRGSSLSIISVK